MVQPVAEPLLLGVLAAADHIKQQSPLGETLESGGLLGGQGGRHQSGPEGDEELEPLGLGE